MPISIILQLNSPLIIEHQLRWTNKIRHTETGESSKDYQRHINWRCWYLCQTLYHSVNLLDKKCHIFTWVLGYSIPSEVLEELLDRNDDNVTHIKHLIKISIEVGNHPLLKPVR